MQCATHPDIETHVACGKCDKPVCHRCMVHTPVGVRCRECAQLRRLPTFHLTPVYYLRATAAGLAIAVATGVLWGLLWPQLVYIPFSSFLVGLGLGFAIGEGMSWAVNRKQGGLLPAIAAGSMLLSYLLMSLTRGLLVDLNLYSLLALALGVFIAASRLRPGR